MLIIKPRPLPVAPDYKAACRHTVTLYNAYKKNGQTYYHKSVFNKSAFLGMKRIWKDTKLGETASNIPLLVIPANSDGKRFLPPNEFMELENKAGYFTLQDNDKAMHGAGNDIQASDEWANLIPAKVGGLIIIKSVDIVRNLQGDIVHVEGGS